MKSWKRILNYLAVFTEPSRSTAILVAAKATVTNACKKVAIASSAVTFLLALVAPFSSHAHIYTQWRLESDLASFTFSAYLTFLSLNMLFDYFFYLLSKLITTSSIILAKSANLAAVISISSDGTGAVTTRTGPACGADSRTIACQLVALDISITVTLVYTVKSPRIQLALVLTKSSLIANFADFALTCLLIAGLSSFAKSTDDGTEEAVEAIIAGSLTIWPSPAKCAVSFIANASC
jgi:hypothetical protein